MPSDANGIANDCPDCDRLKEMLIEAETANAELGRQNHELNHLLRRSARAEIALQNELAKQREEEPDADPVKAVCQHWKTRLGHEKAKTPLSGERAKKVRARLRDKFTVDDLKKAIDGCAKVPYVGPRGRKATGSKRERHDDLTLICRDEETVERFMGYADEQLHPQRVPVGPTGVEAVLGRLEGVKQVKPDQWTAKCPAHEDRHASLSVAQGEKGAVVHCHTGCTADAIAHALGLDIASLFDYEPAPVPRPVAPPIVSLPSVAALDAMAGRLQADPKLLDRLLELRGWKPDTLSRLGIGFDGERLTFPVHNQVGELVNVLRYLPRRASDTPKLLAARGHPRDLFPAPERLDGGEVWLVEGEPDAVSGRQLGLPAVAIPGTNGWRAEWTLRFFDVNVTICFDCDDPGRAAAQRVRRDLEQITSVRVLDLEPERTDGFDLSDALLNGADNHFLTVMADAITEQKVAA